MVLAAAIAVMLLAVAGLLRIGVVPGQPSTTRMVTGTVTLVNADGTAVCLRVEASSEPQCYGLWLLRGQHRPAISDAVTGWIVTVPTSSGQVEQLIVSSDVSQQAGSG